MHNLLPRFIQRRFTANEYHGAFAAATLFCDLSGFTALTRRLTRHGPEGAEVLSGIINDTFRPMINEIYRYGGFVTGFAGDAMTAVLPDDPANARLTAVAVAAAFARRRIQHSRLGRVELALRIGLSGGRVEWGIPGEGLRTWYFRGPAVERCSRLGDRAEPGVVLFDEHYFGATSSPAAEAVRPRLPRRREIHRRVGRLFFPERVIEFSGRGEFRDAAALFIGFTDRGHAELDALVNPVLELCEGYGGYFASLEFADKGPLMLVIFGAPVSYERTLERAADFALSVAEQAEEPLRMGLGWGTVYAGLIGSRRRCTYSLIGDPINLAARLCQRAAPGAILTAPAAADDLASGYRLRPQRSAGLEKIDAAERAVHLEGRRRRPAALGSSGPFYGRRNELKLLERRLLERTGAGGTLYIYGEPGVGKSRLLEEFKRRHPELSYLDLQADAVLRRSLNPVTAHLRRFFLFDGTSEKANAAVFARRFDELVADLLRTEQSGAAALAAALERQRGYLKVLVGLSHDEEDEAGLPAEVSFNNRLFAARDFFRARALLAPSVVVLDDLQWLDDDSRRFFKLLQRLEKPRLSLVLLSRYRDDGAKPRLGDDAAAPELELAELDEADVALFIEQLLGRPVERELYTHILERSAGNPFYLEQLCGYLSENALLEERDGRVQLRGDIASLPDGIRTLLVARLDRLSTRLKQVVKTAAVLGREFDPRILGAVLRGERLEALLREGERELIWLSLSSLLYLFRHVLLREAAYGMMLRGRLRELHGLTARVLEREFPDDPRRYAELAHHYGRAEEPERELRYLELAVDYAVANYHNHDALALLERSLEVEYEAERRISLLLKLGKVQHHLGRWPEADETTARALAAARRIGAEDLIADVQLHRAVQLHFTNRYREAEEAVAECLTHYQLCRDTGKTIDALGVRAMIHQGRSEFPRALAVMERTHELALELGDDSHLAHTLGRLGLIHYELGDFERAVAALERARDLFAGLGNDYKLCHVLGNLGNIHLQQRRLDEARELYEHSLAIAERIDSRMDIGHALANIGVVHLYRRNFDTALDYFARLQKLSLEIGNLSDLSTAHANIGSIHLQLGNYTTAREHLEEMLALTRRIEEKAGASYAHFSLGSMFLEQERLREADEHLQRALELAVEIGMRYYQPLYQLSLAELRYAQGHLDEADDLCRRALVVARETHNIEARHKLRLLRLTLRVRRGETDPVDIEEELAEIEGLIPQEFERRLLSYHRWRLLGGEERRRHALEVLSTLYAEAPLERVRRFLAALEDDRPDLSRYE